MLMVSRFALLLACILFSGATLSAQDRLSMKDGSVLEGKVKSVSADRVAFESGGVVVQIPRSGIADIRLAPEKSKGNAFGITVAAPPPAPVKAKAPAPEVKEAPALKKKPVAAMESPAPQAEETNQKKKIAVGMVDLPPEQENGWKALLQNRLGLDPNEPAKLLLYAFLAFVVMTIVIGISSRLADLYSRTPQRIAGFAACSVILITPQIVWLPADGTIVAAAITADFFVWCLLVRAFFHEHLLKSCVLLVGAAFVLMLVALAGEVGRMMLTQSNPTDITS